MRLRSILLFLSLLVLFLIPVSASDVDNSAAWVNVLDYATLNDTGSNYILFNNSATVRYDTGIQTLIHFVDIVVNTSGADITSAAINGKSLTVLPLDSQVFRIYGAVSYITSGVYDLTFNSSGETYVDILQFHVSGQWRLVYDDVGYFVLDWENAAGHITSKTYTMPNSTSPVSSSFFGQAIYDNFDQTSQPLPYKILFSSTNWRKYDRLDYHFRVKVHSIDSISVTCGDSFLPYSISAFTAPSVGNAESNMHNFYTDNISKEYESTIWWSDNFADRTVDICISMDLSGIDRTSSLYPKIVIHGKTFNEASNQVTLIRTVGHVYQDGVDPYLHFFRIYADSQFAYYDSIISAHQQMYSLVSTGLRSLSADITAASSFVAKEILDLRTSLTAKISSFQTSMETYLDNLPRRIAEEISKVFKPSEGKFEAAKEESQELAEDKLGAVYQSAVVIDQIAGAFTNQSPQTSIAIPLVSVEVLPGVPFAFGGWDVPVVPSGLEFFVETLKFVIDIVCTLAFLNGMKRRLDGLFGGESGAD